MPSPGQTSRVTSGPGQELKDVNSAQQRQAMRANQHLLLEAIYQTEPESLKASVSPTPPEEVGTFTPEEIEHEPEGGAGETGEAEEESPFDVYLSPLPAREADLLVRRDRTVEEIERFCFTCYEELKLDHWEAYCTHRQEGKAILEFLLGHDELQPFWQHEVWNEKLLPVIWANQSDLCDKMKLQMSPETLVRRKRLKIRIAQWDCVLSLGSLIDACLNSTADCFLVPDDEVYEYLSDEDGFPWDLKKKGTMTKIYQDLIDRGMVRSNQLLSDLLDNHQDHLQWWLKKLLQTVRDHLGSQKYSPGTIRNHTHQQVRDAFQEIPTIPGLFSPETRQKLAQDSFAQVVVLHVIREFLSADFPEEGILEEELRRRIKSQRQSDFKTVQGWFKKQQEE